MKRITLISFLLTLGFLNVQAQERDIYIIDDYSYYSQERYLFWDNNYYEVSYRGIESLMNDLEFLEPKLYKSILPTYQQYLLRKKNAATISAIGGVGSAALLGLSIVKFSKKTSRTDFITLQSIRQKSDNVESGVGLLIGSLLALGVSQIFAQTQRIKYRDILSFMNRFNQNTNDEKLELIFRPEIGLGRNPNIGVGLSLRF